MHSEKPDLIRRLNDESDFRKKSNDIYKIK